MRKMGDPKLPTQEEVDEHNIRGHSPYRSWCPLCVEAMGKDMAHPPPGNAGGRGRVCKGPRRARRKLHDDPMARTPVLLPAVTAQENRYGQGHSPVTPPALAIGCARLARPGLRTTRNEPDAQD